MTSKYVKRLFFRLVHKFCVTDILQKSIKLIFEQIYTFNIESENNNKYVSRETNNQLSDFVNIYKGMFNLFALINSQNIQFAESN
ncbi:hypothetical protein, partial [Listeria monocytogenes]|uniref:hypothetical protein n=1 Tax=Listeria monocytogenes TaxID=1639 RepID=UPI00098D30BF